MGSSNDLRRDMGPPWTVVKVGSGPRAGKSRNRTAAGTSLGLGAPAVAARRSPHGEIQAILPGRAAAEIFADRWTPLIIREMLAGSSHFNEIQRGLPGISRTLLSTRLRALKDAEVVARHVGDRPHSTEYRLTPPATSSPPSSSAWDAGGRAGRSATRGRRSSTRRSWSGRYGGASISSACLPVAWSWSSSSPGRGARVSGWSSNARRRPCA